MSIVAIIPAANLPAANAALAAFGPGPHFSVSGVGALGLTHGALHDWGTNTAYVSAIKALPGVVVDEGAGDPAARLKTLFAGVSTQWTVDAPRLPASGMTVAGRIYKYPAAKEGPDELWLSIVAFSRTTFPGHPNTLAASIIRRRRWPGEVLPWKQPIDGFDAYKLLDPITLQPDRVTHLGRIHRVSQADGSGNNVWEPGVFGWTDEGPASA